MAEQFPAGPGALAGLVRAAVGGAGPVAVERAASGQSGAVYRATAGGARYYLRLAEAPGEDLTTDALVLERLRGLGARVPVPVAASAATAAFPRSWMLMTQVPGRSIARAGTDEEARQAAAAAGRDAALVNSVAVSGFGWLRRDGSPRLTAELPGYGQFAVSYLPDPWPGRLGEVLGPRRLDALRALADGERGRPLRAGRLAHGDLDVTHVYARAGRYTGLIDFGEMRGADPCFDLGHFLLHDGETRPARLFESFLAGYRQVTPLGEGHREAIRASAVLLGLRQLSRWLSQERGYPASHPLVRRRAAELSNLLDGRPAHPER